MIHWLKMVEKSESQFFGDWNCPNITLENITFPQPIRTSRVNGAPAGHPQRRRSQARGHVEDAREHPQVRMRIIFVLLRSVFIFNSQTNLLVNIL